MNEIHEDDDRFMVLRSLFKEEHLDWLHGRNYHPEAVYAPKNEWSYAWDYAHEGVRKHFLALFHEWLGYDVDGIELDFVRSPCLFPPGKEEEGMPLMTELIRSAREVVNRASESKGKPVLLGVRTPGTVDTCRRIGLDIETWLQEGLVDRLLIGGGLYPLQQPGRRIGESGPSVRGSRLPVHQLRHPHLWIGRRFSRSRL